MSSATPEQVPTLRPAYTDLQEVRGPLAIVAGVSDIGWDEYCTVRLASGEARHGVVLDVDRDLAVVQVFEGTAGMRLHGEQVTFSGQPLRIPVGAEWLGRTCNGRGEPLDEGPPIVAATTAPVAGVAMNPTARIPPEEPILTGSLSSTCSRPWSGVRNYRCSRCRGCRTCVWRRRSRRRPRPPATRSASSSSPWASLMRTRTSSGTYSKAVRRPGSWRCSLTPQMTP